MDKKYHIWTEGCQMNIADSRRVASALENLGFSPTPRPEEADVIVLNTCVVRQSAEDRAYGRLHSLHPLKKQRPELVINLMGCLVGIKNNGHLKQRFPFVDVFSPPSNPEPLITYLLHKDSQTLEQTATQQRFTQMENENILPLEERGKLVSAQVPIVMGCSHACSFCIIPYRRGAERSRPPDEIAAEVWALVKQGVKEVTLLGQIVDRYGKDLPEGINLAGLLRILNSIEGLERIRFLTSHPNWVTDELLDCVAELPKVMPYIEIPVQAGDDQILEAMRRGYTAEDYRRLVERTRQRIPNVAIASDVIVGFPNESEIQFQRTYDLLENLKLDVVHIARYSPRPGTLAERHMTDNVPEEEKWRRFRRLEELQEHIAAEINQQYLGKTVEVLFEEKDHGRWRGRTPTNKLVFVQSAQGLRGQVHPVQITWSGPWSMQANLLSSP